MGFVAAVGIPCLANPIEGKSATRKAEDSRGIRRGFAGKRPTSQSRTSRLGQKLRNSGRNPGEIEWRVGLPLRVTGSGGLASWSSSLRPLQSTISSFLPCDLLPSVCSRNSRPSPVFPVFPRLGFPAVAGRAGNRTSGIF